MELLIVSFIAGVLTVAAPCILPLLPVIVGGSIARGGKDQKKDWRRPVIITGSLAVSVIVFTLLLKATAILLGVPVMFWQIVSGIIVMALGINFLWPMLWERAALKTGLYTAANKLMGSSYAKKGVAGDALMGFSLGPVFNSCSPTYALIVATVLPTSFTKGFSYLLAYALGLASVLLLIAYAGQSVIKKLGWLANPSGWFRRIIGVLFIVVGVSVILGLDKDFQAFVLERGWYDPISGIEESLR